MVVVGDKEVETRSVAVRERSKGDLGSMPLDEFKAIWQAEFNPLRR
jgi:threonyl-tRNA synthetase